MKAVRLRFAKASWIVSLLAYAALFGFADDTLAAGGTVKVRVVDSVTQKPIPFRMHLRNMVGRTPRIKGVPTLDDHFTADGEITLSLPVGNFFFELECGLEYLERTGHLTMQDDAEDEKVVEMKRIVDLSEKGWWSGDLHVERKPEDLPIAARAETMHVVPDVTWSNKKNLWTGKTPPKSRLQALAGDCYIDLLGGKDEREDNCILYFNLDDPLPVEKVVGPYPPMAALAQNARGTNVWRAARSPTCWDLPLWVGLGCIDSINLAHSDMGRAGMLTDKKHPGKPRDQMLYRGVRGEGQWSLVIYNKLLECGLRLPPTAGSGSGLNSNPVGHNRVYVEVDGEFTYDKWWQNLKAGRCYVTNGPLIIPQIRDAQIGETLTAGAGEKVTVEYEQFQMYVHSRYKLSYLEVVRDNDVVSSFRIDDFIQKKASLPELVFDRSGWFYIRAISDDDKVFRFAQTAPYYVTIGGETRVSRSAGQFFLDWLDEREKMLKIPNAEQAKEVAALYSQARTFWKDLIARANAD